MSLLDLQVDSSKWFLWKERVKFVLGCAACGGEARAYTLYKSILPFPLQPVPKPGLINDPLALSDYCAL